MIRAVSYVRVSSKEQAEEGYSIQAQLEATQAYAAQQGWALVQPFCDRGESARTADRPQFQALLDYLANDSSVSYLIVHKLDRLARNLEDHAAIRARLRKLGVTLVSVMEALEATASGRLVEGILASLNEFYSANLAQEIRKGMHQKVKQGGYPHKAPIGYRNVRIQNGSRNEAVIVPDEEMAPLVQQAFELYATGEWPLNALHPEMTARGLRNSSGNPIARSKLHEMLKRKVYIGIVEWKGVEYEGSHQPLITRDLYDQVQETFHLHNLSGERRRKHTHYLRGTLYCGECGARLCSMTAKGKFAYFFCLGRARRETNCSQPYVPVKLAEQLVLDHYRDIKLPEDIKQQTLKGLEDEALYHEERKAKLAKTYAKTLERLNAERDKLLKAYYADVLTLEVFKKEQERIKTETEEMEAQLKSTQAKVEQVVEIVNLGYKFIENAYAAYLKGSPTTRKRYNQAYFKKVMVRGKEIAEVEYQDFFDFLLSPSSTKTSLVELRGFEPLTF